MLQHNLAFNIKLDLLACFKHRKDKLILLGLFLIYVSFFNYDHENLQVIAKTVDDAL